MKETVVVDAALAYASIGWHVLPLWSTNGTACECGDKGCASQGKHPHGILGRAGGQHHATVDEQKIRSWWSARPTANVGIALAPSGLIAFDQDGAGWQEKVATLEAQHGPRPISVTQISGSGDRHVIFRAPQHPIRGAIGGITLRGRNFVVAAPSLHRTGNRYRWAPGLGPSECAIAELPPAWLEAIRRPELVAPKAPQRAIVDAADFYAAVESLDQRHILECVSGTALVSGEAITFKPSGRGKYTIVIDGKPRGGWIDASGRIGHASKGASAEGPDGGPFASTWLRYYGNTDVEIRRGLIEHVPELERFARTSDARRTTHRLPPPKIESTEMIVEANASPDTTDTTAGWGRFDDAPIGTVYESSPSNDTTGSNEHHETIGGRAHKRERFINVFSDAPIDLARVYLEHRGSDEQKRAIVARWAREWWRWSDGAYRALDEERFRSEMWSLLSRVTVERWDDKGKPTSRPLAVSRRLIGDISEALLSVAPLVEGPAPTWIGAPVANGDLVACSNGILDLDTGRLAPLTPCYFTTNVVGAPWDENALDPTNWIAFLRSLWGDDDERIRTLQMMFGYFLSTDASLQKIFQLVGPKRSGKSTIGRVLDALLGPEAVAHPTLGSLEGEFGLSSLVGKRVAIIGDARLGGRDQATVVERLLSISGEDPITVNRKFREPVSMSLGVRLLLISNELPRLHDASGALASRFVILPTERSFYGAEDTSLLPRLLAELPAILKWSVDGWHELQRRGRIQQPEAGRYAAEDLEALTSPMGVFISDECTIGDELEVETTRLYERWCTWCEAHGREATSMERFGTDLRLFVPKLGKEQRRFPDGKRRRFYLGVDLA